APRAQTIQILTSTRSTANLSLRHEGAAPAVVAAGFGGAVEAAPVTVAEPSPSAGAEHDGGVSETAWRVRHARVSVLKDVDIPGALLAEGGHGLGAPIDLVEWAVLGSTKTATAYLTETSFTGQFNLLTAGSFDTPQELFASNNSARNIAFGRVSAPAGSRGDWSLSGALTQSDFSSWIVAGAYNSHAPATHRYDVGLNFATARYDNGNLPMLREASGSSRNASMVYGYDTYTLSPILAVAYGATYANYDYLENRNLVSPRVEMTLTPSANVRVSAAAARRELAPGAEEFLPPSDSGVWVPMQRTFSAVDPNNRFNAEAIAHEEIAAERDFGQTTVALRAFHQQVDNQLVTIFGLDVPGQPTAASGHYVVGNAGEAEALGYAAGVRTLIADRVHGEIEYSFAQASLSAGRDSRYLLVLAPSTVRDKAENIHSVQGRVETDVPETSTRVLVLYRVSTGFAKADTDRSGIDSRFDVQVRQSLPFMNFSNARWEMLVAVRNFFREAATDQAIYDELLVVKPPKRVVGGVTMRF
ncbi:MAG: TonB-dependent receptor, partial [Acidobacteriaceae bacterium]|nr:TonB-dependent receptor [Acidobacteriaceae bacterium]